MTIPRLWDDITIVHREPDVVRLLVNHELPFATIRANDEGDILILDADGNLLKMDEHGSCHVDSAAPESLHDIWISPEGSYWVVGEQGLVACYSNGEWQSPKKICDQTLCGVWGTSDRDIYVCGYFGSLWHFDGTAWAQVTLTTRKHLHHIAGIPNGRITIAGALGIIVERDRPGLPWEEHELNVDQDVNAVIHLDDGITVAAGDTGLIVIGDNDTGWQSAIQDSDQIGSMSFHGLSGNSKRLYMAGGCGEIATLINGAISGLRVADDADEIHGVWSPEGEDAMMVGWNSTSKLAMILHCSPGS